MPYLETPIDYNMEGDGTHAIFFCNRLRWRLGSPCKSVDVEMTIKMPVRPFP